MGTLSSHDMKLAGGHMLRRLSQKERVTTADYYGSPERDALCEEVLKDSHYSTPWAFEITAGFLEDAGWVSLSDSEPPPEAEEDDGPFHELRLTEKGVMWLSRGVDPQYRDMDL